MIALVQSPSARRILGLFLAVLVLPLGSPAGHAQGSPSLVSHDLAVELHPDTGTLQVTDRITLPESLGGEDVEFLLNSRLVIEASEPALSEVPMGDREEFFGINGTSLELGDEIELTRYRLDESPADGVLTVTYGGNFDFGLSDQKEEYTRGFRETVGVIGEEGVYLAGSGFWYPYLTDELIEFKVEVEQPDGWQVISQGNGSASDDEGRARWDSAGPMDEIYLVGGPLEVYRDAAGAVEALVYLHERDDALAAKYLTATAQYIEMYRELIGPYPYEKFALVENFWETGYGMPSFTLLGPSIIRFPFILTSSYPHEILHNWWGNSVFVDYRTGNWCEGLTAYLADHLIQEQRGKGADYRRAALQKYRDFVKDGRDFPLAEFRSRHSAATEAVGYGKTLMGFHALRRHVGDDAFREIMVRFYRANRGKKASFDDVRATFEQVSGEDLAWFFDSWVKRPGAVSLEVAIDDVKAGTTGGWTVHGSLVQNQNGDLFDVEVPVVLQMEDGVQEGVVRIDERTNELFLVAASRPIALHIDPQFDVFRVLDPRETPPSIGQIFGEPEILAVLPSSADAELQAAYRALVEGWVSDVHSIEIRLDSEVEALPSDRPVWILGSGNRLAESLFGGGAVEGLAVSGSEIAMADEKTEAADHSLVVIRRHPANLDKAIGWLVVDPLEAFAGMGRKLPHYGKYSYLAFEGSEPANVIKGQWPTSDSPLSVDLRTEKDGKAAMAPLQVAQREALADLPPVFSGKALAAHVEYLASDELEGRGVSSDGARKAADYIVQQFEAAGLTPGGEDGGWFQTVPLKVGPEGGPAEARNVIGIIPGKNAEWSDQSFVVSAHYDHLGQGWPDVHAGDEGKIHHGADDNASGVAVMLELAKNLAEAEPPSRNLVFVAFSAEEAGRLGSRYFTANPTPFPASGIRGNINLDTVGRLFDQKVQVLGTGTSEEWQHIFRGAGFVTGIDSRNVPAAAGGSDQMSFIEVGIPGVQIFTQAHGDYHRPGDTADKIDYAGLVKIATFVKEGVVYMGEREEPLTITIEGSAAEEAPAPDAGPTSGRKVRFGTVPDFAFPGPGVKVESVVPDSPAAKAGVEGGDVLIKMAGQELGDLRGYSDVLKTLEAGQEVGVVVLRDGNRVALNAVLEAR